MQGESPSFPFLYGCGRNDSRPAWDTVLFESPNFVALPTVGALVKGWLLIVPRKFHLCYGALDESLFAEFESFKSEVVSAVENCFGQVAVFEHGPASKLRSSGCGVDHAHVHVVPTEIDLVQAASKLQDSLNWQEVPSLRSSRSIFTQGVDYLYVEQPIGAGFICCHSSFPSQLMRRVIANFLGAPERYDWRRHPMLENVLATISELQRENTDMVLLH